MVNYWKAQHIFDVLLSLFITVALVLGPKFGAPIIVNVSPDSLILSARAWVGPALTLLGMMSATTAFIFSVVDRGEFQPLRALGVEAQLWDIFAQNIFWLAVAAISAMVIAFVDIAAISIPLLAYATFLFIIVAICLIKFAWVMTQIISVRASR